MSVPHIRINQKHHGVVTAPVCEQGNHDICAGHGLRVTELNLFFFHIQWRQTTSCGCVCHFEGASDD